jgi:hypothetical protein
MKRTAKWHKALTLAQLRHLRDMKVLNLDKFLELRAWQVKKRAEDELNGYMPGVAEPCFECCEIARRLKAAGYGRNIDANHQPID